MGATASPPRLCPRQVTIDAGAGARPAPAPPTWTLPGTGDACDPSYRSYRCPAGHEWAAARHDCGRRECPDCAQGWRRSEAAAIADRVTHWAQIAYRHPRIDHVQVSWPPETAIDRPRMVAAATRALRAMGYHGWSVVMHPWRGSEQHGYSTPGPHLHVVAIAPRREGGVGGVDYDPDLHPGLVVRVIRHLGALWGRIYRVAHYELGHVGIAPGHHAVSWGGVLHRRFTPTPTDGYTPDPTRLIARRQDTPQCPTCGQAASHVLMDDWTAYPPQSTWAPIEWDPPDTEPPPWA